ncbi:MAG TPA: beta-galactosidase family protein [Arachidicoccus soli]|nr:beta-galactosidase family protein [Arachidicoccus soli]
MNKRKTPLASLILGCLILLSLTSSCQQKKQEKKVNHTFALGDSAFLLDHKPFQIISGEMHYPRIPREAWLDRMKKAKAMGLNTISTYVFWNLQEPQKGKFDFSGNNDIAQFVRDAQKVGLWVILRPSPYVCAEWEFGGYPYWLQNIKGLVVRSKEKQYIEEYKKYIDEVGKQLAPLQINHGGNILMVQIENEYGSYGNDKSYLQLNEQLFRNAGFDGLLYTCDPPEALNNGYLTGLLPAVNGLSDTTAIKNIIRKHHSGKGPFMVAEWYPAWFDWWGTKHHTVPAAAYAKQLNNILKAGISINMYMFHGGTTRGFMNGANYKETTPFEPQISSYDYDAPLDEAGNVTEKFKVFRSVIEKYLPKGEKLPPIPAPKPTMEISDIQFTAATSIANILSTSIKSPMPLTFEALQQAYGFVLYRTILEGGAKGILQLDSLRDYAIIMINGQRVGVLDRRLNQNSMSLSFPKGNDTLDLLVENLGRINFGPNLLKNNKGITHSVSFAGKELKGWTMYDLPFDNMVQYHFEGNKSRKNEPILRKGSFQLTKIADTYLDMRKWGKGVVWINGHNLGRYWRVGPQQTIYVPAEWLKKGENSIEILELLKPEQTELKGIQFPILDSLQTE